MSGAPAAAPPRIAVLGVGLIGGSIGLAARRGVPGAEVVGFDPAPAALEAALRRGAVTTAATSIGEAVAGAGACFACAPVGALPELVAAALGAAAADCVVSDVGSTKGPLRAAGSDGRFVGGHPVAGAETAGIEHAREDLFDGAPWYLTPGAHASGVLYERLHRLVSAFGGRPAAIDADLHDRLLAAVSHLPHVLANVLVTQAEMRLADEGEALPRTGPSFRDATRVAGSNSGIWTDIYVANGRAIAAEIDELVARLTGAAALLRAGDPVALADWNDEAGAARTRLLESDAAGGRTHELRVTVPNRPGIVAQVALALGRAGVNIADLALAPAPDGRSGAVTLWVTGEDAGERARALIAELGFPVASAA